MKNNKPEGYTSLVISRRPGESVWIGNVLVTIGGMRAEGVQVRITAPRDVRIIREELIKDETEYRVNYWYQQAGVNFAGNYCTKSKPFTLADVQNYVGSMGSTYGLIVRFKVTELKKEDENE